MQHIVGISDMKMTTDPTDVIITYSLGSCVGVTVYDTRLKIGALVHCLLPLSKTDKARAETSPCMFVDTGMMSLISAMMEKGSKQRDLIACVAGGATIIDQKKTFNIGERNYAVLRKVLWKNNILIAAEDIGGSSARTMYLEMESGKSFVKSGTNISELKANERKTELAKDAS